LTIRWLSRLTELSWFSASFGVVLSRLVVCEISAEQLILDAGHALFLAKGLGRNQIAAVDLALVEPMAAV
jgi:hypothetical protein